MIKKTIFSLILLAFTIVIYAQESHSEHKGHNHENEHPKNELGISLSPVYFIKGEELSVTTHLHYVYNFQNTKFGIGLGYERIFDEHKHNFLGFELNYRPIHQLILNISPGVAFEGDQFHEKEFALHFESVYEFEFKSFHIGPVFELAYHPEDFHISLGIHLGLGF
jgi:hypothetical protein